MSIFSMCLLYGCLFAFAATTLAEDKRDEPSEQAYARINAALTSEWTETVDKLPLNEFVPQVAERYKIPIWIKEEALVKAAIDSKSLVSCAMPPVSLESALQVVLSPLGLDFVLCNELLCITTKDDVEQTPVDVVYDLKTPYSARSIAELLQKTADAQSVAGSPRPVVHLLTPEEDSVKKEHLFVRANMRIHRDISQTLERLKLR